MFEKSYDVTFVVKTNVKTNKVMSEEEIAEIAIEQILANPRDYIHIENLDGVEIYFENPNF
jgi:isocitrate dehydrogenase